MKKAEWTLLYISLGQSTLICCVVPHALRHVFLIMLATLRVVSGLLIHKRFGQALLEKNGLDFILAVPITPFFAAALGHCLASFAVNTHTFEALCAVPYVLFFV